MLEELSSLYSNIIGETVAGAPEDWSRLWIRTSCAEGAWTVGAYWERQGTEEVIFFQLPEEASWLIYRAWEVSRSYNDNWTTALFRIDQPDKLQISFSREDLADESYDPVESQAAFRAKTFGDRKIRSTIDMSGAVSLTPQMLQSGSIGPQA